MLIPECDCAINCGEGRKIPSYTLVDEIAHEFVTALEFPHMNVKYLTRNSHLMCTWKCSNSHTWNSTAYNRSTGNMCPFCSGKIPIIGENDFQTLHKSIAAQWDYTLNKSNIPSDYLPYSGYRAFWLCSFNHSWQAKISDRVKYQTGCPYCSKRKILVGFNDLASTHNFILNEWDYEENIFTPEQVTSGSKKLAAWQHIHSETNNIHRWKATILSRTKDKTQCPICCNQKVLKNFNDLAYQYPELLREWDYAKNTIVPTTITAGSHVKAWWVCGKGHSWQAQVKSRAYNKAGCGKCKLVATSKIEQDFHKELNKHLDTCNESYLEKVIFPDGSKMQVDIFGSLKDQKIAIEYDGNFYHEKKIEEDSAKTQKLLENGFLVVRIREKDLKFLSIKNINLLQLRFDYFKDKDDIDTYVLLIKEWLDIKCADINS